MKIRGRKRAQNDLRLIVFVCVFTILSGAFVFCDTPNQDWGSYYSSKNAIKKLSIKLGEYSWQYLSVAAALKKLKGAWKECCATKKIASDLKKTFLEELIARKAFDQHMPLELLQTMIV